MNLKLPFLWLHPETDMEPKSVMDMALIPCIDPVDIGLGSSDKGNVIPPPKRKKTMTSVYLKYFETAPDGKSRRCKFCGQSYSIATATGNHMHLILVPFFYFFQGSVSLKQIYLDNMEPVMS